MSDFTKDEHTLIVKILYFVVLLLRFVFLLLGAHISTTLFGAPRRVLSCDPTSFCHYKGCAPSTRDLLEIILCCLMQALFRFYAVMNTYHQFRISYSVYDKFIGLIVV